MKAMKQSCPKPIDLSDGQSFAKGFPHGFFTTLRDLGVPYWHEPTAITPDGEGFWVVSRYQDIAALFRDAETFSSDRGGTRVGGGTSLKDEASAGKILNQTDNPHHRRLRELVQKGFTTRAIAKLETDIRARTRDVLSEFLAGNNPDFVPQVARELPLQAICTILGVPLEDRETLVDLAWDIFARAHRRKASTSSRRYFVSYHPCATRRICRTTAVKF